MEGLDIDHIIRVFTKRGCTFRGMGKSACLAKILGERLSQFPAEGLTKGGDEQRKSENISDNTRGEQDNSPNHNQGTFNEFLSGRFTRAHFPLDFGENGQSLLPGKSGPDNTR